MRLSSLLRRSRDENGFTMVTAVGAMLIVMIVSAAAVAAGNGDVHLSRYDQDDKQAYAAAEAGINEYLAQLNQDSNYWTNCTAVGSPNAVNQKGATGAGRKWLDVPGSQSEYSLELIPAPGKTSCDTADPIGSMIDADGNLKIRSTGRVDGTNNYRSINATFRRTGFLDSLYFTDLENMDPAYSLDDYGSIPTRATNSAGTPIAGGQTLVQWAADKCEHHWWGTQAAGEGRKEMPQWQGQSQQGTGWSSVYTRDTGDLCNEITFASDDKVNGPFHSNDDILVSGSPDFGRDGKNDKVEVSGDGFRPSSASPVFHPSLTLHAKTLDLPPSNASIEQVVDKDYLFRGQTKIVLTGATMTVTNPNLNGGAAQSMARPANGVIMVKNDGCAAGYNPADTEVQDPDCGDVRLSGSYSNDLTIAAENDIVVTGNVTRPAGSSALLGLIANGWVRVWHPVTGCDNRSDTPKNVQIDAAILSLHSFTVDNYSCGSPLGNLTVNGAIAQKHRGVVGRGGSSISNGYVKNYNYDEKLKYRSPPYFLDPVQAAWRILRQSEQSPPARG